MRSKRNAEPFVEKPPRLMAAECLKERMRLVPVVHKLGLVVAGDIGDE